MKNILEQFLDAIDVRYTRFFTDALYNEHPHKYNMYGIKMMLDVFGIKSLGVRIPDKDFSLLTYPCILHTNSDFVIALKSENSTLTYLQHGVKNTLAHNSFKHLWTGNALVIEESTDAGEPCIKSHIRHEIIDMLKMYGVFALIVITATIGSLKNYDIFSIYDIISIFVSSIGSFVCVMLVQKQIFGRSRFGDSICNLFNHSDCNNVLDGPKSKAFGISWSEIGLGYFIATILSLSLLPQASFCVSIINWIAMPYGIWSIYYQWKIAKNWCMLCVISQILIWIIGITAIIQAISTSLILTPYEIVMSCIIFLFCILMVNHLVSRLSMETERAESIQRYRSLKAKDQVASALIGSGDFHETRLDDSSIIFGPRDAKIRITILSNPHCNPCAKMHKKVELLLSQNNDICIQYILSAFNTELEDSSRYLISCYLGNNETVARQIFERWYTHDKYNYINIIKKEKEHIHNKQVEEEMQRHKTWKEKTSLSATPTILINGHILPKEYELLDIPMIVNLSIQKNILQDINGRSTKPLGAE